MSRSRQHETKHSQASRPEHCMNPFNPQCRNTDIELSIMWKDEERPICRECWADLAEKEWKEGEK